MSITFTFLPSFNHGKNPLYATGDYRQRMEGVFIKAKQQ